METVCEVLQTSFDLPPFEYDCHDNWRYAYAGNDFLHVNVTKADDNSTIETWIDNCPKGANFQICLTSASEPPQFLLQLKNAMNCEVVRYAVVTPENA